MLQNYYHLPFFRGLRTIARKVKVLDIVKKNFFKSTSYEEPFNKALKEAVKTGDVVWDVGANVGIYTNLFSEWVGKKGTVIAFEPEPNTFITLQKSIAAIENVFLVPKALSDTSGISFFSVSIQVKRIKKDKLMTKV